MGRKSREGIMGEKEDCIIVPELNWEPVKVNEGWGDVLPGLGAGENPGS